MTETDSRIRAGQTKRLQSEAKLVAATAKIVERDGVDFRLDKVAERADLSMATLYKRFETRSDLILRTFSDVVVAELASVTEGEFRSDRSTVKRLEAWVKALDEVGHDHMNLTRAALIARLQVDVTIGKQDDADDEWDVVESDPILRVLVAQIKDMMTLNSMDPKVRWASWAEEDLAPQLLYLVDCAARSIRVENPRGLALELMTAAMVPILPQEATQTSTGFQVG